MSNELVAFFSAQQDSMTDILIELVEIESPSGDKAAVDRMGKRVAELMHEVGGEVEVFPRDHAGDLVLGRWPGNPEGRKITLLCHMDTVWPVGTLTERPVRIEDGRLFGPGAYDMKAGIVIALTALRGLSQIGLQAVGPIAMLCTGDEEIGSSASRGLIEELAAESGLVLCLEPALPGGLVKTARKGVGFFHLRVRGRPAHAGANHEQGINAIEEAARHILSLQALTDYDRGTTISVGRVRGGTATNVVPAECEFWVDFRVETLKEAKRLTKTIEEMQPIHPGAKLEVTGGLNRPPMVRDATMQRTFKQARRIAAVLDLELEEESTGGGSDANFTAAMGIPTLDGLGAVGDGAHSVTENVQVASLPIRAALLTSLLSEWEW